MAIEQDSAFELITFKYYFLRQNFKFCLHAPLRGKFIKKIIIKNFIFNKMSIIIEGKNISNNDDAEYVFEPTN